MSDRHGPKYVLQYERTLAEMRAANAHVILAGCDCSSAWVADLDKLIVELGEDGCLWDRRIQCGKCKVYRHYMASAGKGTPPRPLLSGGRQVLGLPPSALAERQRFLASFGFSARDLVRIKAMAESLTDNTSPASLNDLDVPYRVAACWPGSEDRYSGDVLGGWAGRTLLYWRMMGAEADVWRRRPKGPRRV